MKYLRVVFSFIFNWLLWILLGFGLAILAISINITDRQNVKSWPVEAGIYENFFDVLPELIKEEADTDGQAAADEKSLQEMLDQSGLNQEELFLAFEEALPPEYLESQVNVALDALYELAEGDRDVLAFKILLSEKAPALAASLKEELISQIEKYPRCTATDIIGFANGEFEPLEANCIPPGINVRAEINRFTDEFTVGEDAVLSDFEVTAADTEAINNNVSLIQFAYSQARNLAWTLLILGALLVGLVIITAPSILRGLRKAGAVLFVQGITTIIIFLLVPRFSSATLNSARNDEDIPEEVIDTLVEPLFDVVLKDISNTGVRLGGFVALVGAALWLSVYIWHKIHHQRQDAHAPAEHLQSASSTNELPEVKDPAQQPEPAKSKPNSNPRPK